MEAEAPYKPLSSSMKAKEGPVQTDFASFALDFISSPFQKEADKVTVTDYIYDRKLPTRPFPYIICSIRHLLAKKKDILNDIMAGFSIAAVVLPESYVHAINSKLPSPRDGIYTALWPVLVYALIANTRYFRVGSTGLVTMLMSFLLSADSKGVINTRDASLLVLLCGVLQILLGLLKFGFIESIMTLPMIKGFSLAVGLLGIQSQIFSIYDIKMPRSYFDRVKALVTFQGANFNQILFCVFIGALCMFINWLAVKYPKRVIFKCHHLILIIVGTIVLYVTGVDAKKTYKCLCGLPNNFSLVTPGLPFYSGMTGLDDVRKHVARLLPRALVLLLASSFEVIPIKRRLESEKHFIADNNNELVSFGFSNFVGAFFKSYIPVVVSSGRTSISLNVGGRTQFTSIFSIFFVVVTILLFPMALTGIPQSIMLTINMIAIISGLEFRIPIQYFKFFPWDFIQFLTTFLVTIYVDVTMGIFVSLAISILIIIEKSTRMNLYIQETEQEKMEKRLSDANRPKESKEEIKVRDPKFRRVSTISMANLDQIQWASEICFCQLVDCAKTLHVLIFHVDNKLYYANFYSVRCTLWPVLLMVARKRDCAKIVFNVEQWFGGDATIEDVLPGPLVRNIVLNFESTDYIDYTAAFRLVELIAIFKAVEVDMLLAAMKPTLQIQLEEMWKPKEQKFGKLQFLRSVEDYKGPTGPFSHQEGEALKV